MDSKPMTREEFRECLWKIVDGFQALNISRILAEFDRQEIMIANRDKMIEYLASQLKEEE